MLFEDVTLETYVASLVMDLSYESSSERLCYRLMAFFACPAIHFKKVNRFLLIDDFLNTNYWFSIRWSMNQLGQVGPNRILFSIE